MTIDWNLQSSEIILYIAFVISIIALVLLFYNLIHTAKPEIKSQKSKDTPNDTKAKKKKEKRKSNIVEIFDYLGTKIVHDNGHYTVNHEGLVQNYSSWLEMPEKFKKMVKEIDNRSLSNKPENDYFLEIINGDYFVTTPGGKKRRYKSMREIPEHIRRVVGKI